MEYMQAFHLLERLLFCEGGDVLSLLIWPIEKNQSFYHAAKTKAISTEILRACKRAGYQGQSFKSFRHFAATFLVNAGVPIEIIKDFMGHRNISTTMIYALEVISSYQATTLNNT